MTREEFLRWATRFPDALLLVTRDGKIVACNSTLSEMTGLPVAEISQKSLFDWVDSNSHHALEAALSRWSGSGRMIYAPLALSIPQVGRVRCEGSLLSQSTDQGPASLLVRIKSQDQAVGQFLGLNHRIDELHKDIRLRKQTEAEIRKQREWLHVTLSSIGDAVIATDTSGHVEFLNPVAEQLTGWTSPEARGRPMTEVFRIINEYTREPAENPVAQVLREGIIVGLANHTVLLSRDGREYPIEDSAAPIRNGEGAIIGVVLVFHDVSAQHHDRRSLEKARDEALAASRAKDDFIAALSHELRTPLNPVLLIATEAAENPQLPDAVRNDFNVIAKNALLEARLIDDLLDVTRIARGKLSLELAPAQVGKILADAVNTVKNEIISKGLTFQLNHQATRDVVQGDAARLQQVFWNVLNNAVKFSPPGGHIGIATRNPDPSTITIQFTDTGRGMTEGELKFAFSAFYQGDHAADSSRHRFGGLGLGLAISRTLIELHGGSIEAKSDGRGRGATFLITLPAGADGARPSTPPATAAPAAAAPAEHRESRLLLVEDHEPTRQSLTALLRRRGYVVVSCGSAESALNAAQEGSFDLVLSDLGLPDVSGLELMKELNRRYGLRGIAVTGYGTEKDIAESRAAGFLAHLTKPVSVQALDAALKSFPSS
jgi:PAS domain S-box-containing protein